jgi:hypothetical protein
MFVAGSDDLVLEALPELAKERCCERSRPRRARDPTRHATPRDVCLGAEHRARHGAEEQLEAMRGADSEWP